MEKLSRSKLSVSGAKKILTKSSYASLMAVRSKTPIRGTAVVTGVNEEINGINCSTKRHRK